MKKGHVLFKIYGYKVNNERKYNEHRKEKKNAQ